MREIKFRVWDKLGKSFFGGEFKWNKLPQMLYPDDFIPCQFTGLQDKNNKDIYEGDILLRAAAGYKYIVFWDTPEGSWKLKDQDGDISIYLGDFSMKNLEVIGNIFENEN